MNNKNNMAKINSSLSCIGIVVYTVFKYLTSWQTLANKQFNYLKQIKLV